MPEIDFWLDPWDARDSVFVSHAHADHFSRHGNVLCSTVTAQLLHQRFKLPQKRLQPIDFGVVIERDGFRMRILPAGHIVGSGMLHLRRIRDGATLLYTGDFKVRRGRTAEQIQMIQADVLVMETTFGMPHLIFPSPMEVEASVLRFVHDAFADGEPPVLFGYSLGKAQEVIALLTEHEIPVLSHPKVAEMTEVCRAVGLDLPEPIIFQGYAEPGHVVIAPPNAIKAKALRGLKNKRTAMLSGWALQQSARYRYRVDEVIPMSDHADYLGLMECVTRVKPKRVLTVHGFAKEFASSLRDKGVDAWSAMGGDQLELATGQTWDRSVTTAGISRQIRPTCEFADFSDICRLIGETSSRLNKVNYLAGYLRGLELNVLQVVARWFTGRLSPRGEDREGYRLGNVGIKRSLLKIPGLSEPRYREISHGQNDIARTARILLQDLSIKPNPNSINDIDKYLIDLKSQHEDLKKIESLSERLFEMHWVESETLIKLLTGDLRIGLKEGLVEEGIARAFEVDVSEVRHAHMLTSDLGMVAGLAKNSALETARFEPMVPVRCMLASPFGYHQNEGFPAESEFPFPSPLWLEPKYDGIRAQLHKHGDQVGLFSRDLRPLDQEFPELIEEAKRLEGDFVLDGELIAFVDGRKLGFADLQKRLGRKRVEADLFMDFENGAALPPLRYFAFDALWFGGEDLLSSPLWMRREKLESLSLDGMFSMVERIQLDEVAELGRRFKRSLQEGYEGLMLKDPESVYSLGRRGRSWLKLKGVMPTLDCVVVFAEQGHGKRSDVLSDYTFAVRDEMSGELRVIGKAYSGLRDEEIETLTDHFERYTISKDRRKRKVEPNVVLEIAFDAIRRSSRHNSGLALRFPRIKGIRWDKSVEEIDTLKSAERLLVKR